MDFLRHLSKDDKSRENVFKFVVFLEHLSKDRQRQYRGFLKTSFQERDRGFSRLCVFFFFQGLDSYSWIFNTHFKGQSEP